MPIPNKKPTLNMPIDITFPHGKKKPGKWDGSHWWIQTQIDGPWVPVKDTFVKEWKARV